jgi:hypothetical protein
MNQPPAVVSQEQPLALAQDPIASGLASIIAGGVTPANVEALGKLADIYERMQLKEAEKAFNSAFVALQADLPVIVAQTVIPNRGKYERFEDVMHTVGPLLKKHGFSVSFSMTANEGRVIETCHLRHIAGHSQSNSFAVRTGKADSDTQADCKAATTAKRNALLNCLNIVIRQDMMQTEDDARNDGPPISFDEQQYLREQIEEKGAKLEAMLKMAGAETIETIGKNIYPVLLRALAMKKPANTQ